MKSKRKVVFKEYHKPTQICEHFESVEENRKIIKEIFDGNKEGMGVVYIGATTVAFALSRGLAKGFLQNYIGELRQRTR